MNRRFLVLMTVVLAACVTTNATMLNPSLAPRPKVLPAHVVIYRTADQVKGKYEELALLNASGESGWTNEQQMFESMRRKAGELGANAIILDAISEPSAGAKVAAAVFGTGTTRKGRSVAIYVFPDSTVR